MNYMKTVKIHYLIMVSLFSGSPITRSARCMSVLQSRSPDGDGGINSIYGETSGWLRLEEVVSNRYTIDYLIPPKVDAETVIAVPSVLRRVLEPFLIKRCL